MKNSTSLTVVTAVFNGGATLEKCIQSVQAQVHSKIEHVIVDGGSDDTTLDILKSYEGRLRYISEPDKGIYDAMNKGVVLGEGEWILFLGADDYLSDQDAIAALFSRCPEDLSDFSILTGYARYADGRLYRSDSANGLRWRNRIHHQGALYRRTEILARPFDVDLRIYGDYDFNLARWLAGARFFHTTQLVSILGTDGASDRPRWRNYREDMRVRARHLNGFILYMGHVFAVGRYFYKASLLAFYRSINSSSRKAER